MQKPVKRYRLRQGRSLMMAFEHRSVLHPVSCDEGKRYRQFHQTVCDVFARFPETEIHVEDCEIRRFRLDPVQSLHAAGAPGADFVPRCFNEVGNVERSQGVIIENKNLQPSGRGAAYGAARIQDRGLRLARFHWALLDQGIQRKPKEVEEPLREASKRFAEL